MSANEPQGRTVAFVAAGEGVERVEPWSAVEQAGGTTGLLASEAGGVQVGDADPGDVPAFRAGLVEGIAEGVRAGQARFA